MNKEKLIRPEIYFFYWVIHLILSMFAQLYLGNNIGIIFAIFFAIIWYISFQTKIMLKLNKMEVKND